MSKRGKGSLNAELASLFDPTPKEIVPEEEDWEDPQVENEFDDGAGDEVEDDGRLALRADISLTQGKYKGVPSTRENFGFTKKDDQSSDLSDQEDEDISSSSEVEDEMNDPFQQAMHEMVSFIGLICFVDLFIHFLKSNNLFMRKLMQLQVFKVLQNLIVVLN